MKVANTNANNNNTDSNNSKSPSKQDLTEDPSDTFSDVEITVACPDSNDNDKSLVELQMSAEVRQAYLYRNAKICCAVLILVALLATAVILGVVLQNESPDNDTQVLPISVAQNSNEDKETNTSPSSTAAYPMFCTKDARLCSDWSTVGRNPENNCVFDACPEGTCWVEHLVTCDDGVTKVCNSKSLCPESQSEQAEAAESAPEEASPPACPREMKMCSDLTFVTFSGPNCELAECPEGSCLVDSYECPDGTMVGRNVDKNCEFSTCPANEEQPESEEPECTREIRFCSDGKFVVRDTRTCQFPPCPNN